MAFDPERGFSLNGERVPLHGVAMHQDYLGRGWAIAERDTDESLALVREIGANTLRLAHYPMRSTRCNAPTRWGWSSGPKRPS